MSAAVTTAAAALPDTVSILAEMKELAHQANRARAHSFIAMDGVRNLLRAFKHAAVEADSVGDQLNWADLLTIAADRLPDGDLEEETISRIERRALELLAQIEAAQATPAPTPAPAAAAPRQAPARRRKAVARAAAAAR